MTLAQRLAARCRQLQQLGLDATRAEARTFGELFETCVTEAPAGRQQQAGLGAEASGEPDLHTLYEDFLSAYAPDLRRRHGVYATPQQVVGAQVRLTASLLVQRLGCPRGFEDERVLVVDPAVGAGAYPLAVLAQARVPPMRMRLFEPMIGAACIARARGLTVEERDALAQPVALEAPIVVCLGNPPYERGHLADGKGGFVRQRLLDDFRGPANGLHLKNVYNDYVYFWRWALWATFEQRAGPGVVCFVTPASYLGGPGFAGMRERLRRVLDELWLVDLAGDGLAARKSDNVFPIRTPVAIGLGVRYAEARPDEPATVHYAQVSGSRTDKLTALDSVRAVGDLAWQSPVAGWTLAFVPRTRTAYETWPTLTELFPWQLSGAQLKRTWPIAPTPEVLHERWQRLLELSLSERAVAFRETRDRQLDSTVHDLRDSAVRLPALRGLQPGSRAMSPARYAYRSFDRQWVLPDARLGDFMRPALWRVAGPRQIFVTSLLTNVLGPGPAAVATTLVPDMDHFRGSFGARAVIPLWCDTPATRPNVADGFLQRLSDDLGVAVGPEQLLAYCYALLATRGYVARFTDELRTPGPRVPLTGDAHLFETTAELGQRLLRVHTYAEVIRGAARSTVPIAQPSPSHFTYDAASQTLLVGDGSFELIAPAVWGYSVSGLRVLPGWLRRRVGVARNVKSPLDGIRGQWNAALSQELLELMWLLEATLEMEPALDVALGQIVSGGGSQAWPGVGQQVAHRLGA